MRLGLLALVGVALVLAGVACLPLVDNTRATPGTTRVLTVSVTSPSADVTVPHGAEVTLTWSAANLTGQAGTVSIVVESRTDLARTTVLSDGSVVGTSGTGSCTWDTTGYAGSYALIARIDAGSENAEYTATARVLVDPVPSFTFTAPTADANFELGQDDPLVIAWTGSDNDATAQIGLDPDQDHGYGSSSSEGGGKTATVSQKVGNEIFIHDVDLPEEAEADELEWDGTDSSGANVSAGTYYLFARISDGVNTDVLVEGLGQITVTAGTVDPGETGLVVAEPSDDTELLGGTVAIEYRANQEDDVLIDLRVDPDQDHSNGNEVIILAQQLVEGDTDPPVFDWDGTDSDGNPIIDVPVEVGDADGEGIYQPYAVMFVESGSSSTAESDGLVFQRSSADLPLIALLSPVSDLEVDSGADVVITWRDDIPLEQDADGNVVEVPSAEKARIELWIDDDPIFAEAAETGEAKKKLPMPERFGAPDGVSDTYTWHITTGFATADTEYYLFATIDNDGADPPDDVSVAGGTITIDPAP